MRLVFFATFAVLGELCANVSLSLTTANVSLSLATANVPLFLTTGSFAQSSPRIAKLAEWGVAGPLTL